MLWLMSSILRFEHGPVIVDDVCVFFRVAVDVSANTHRCMAVICSDASWDQHANILENNV
jgi:hypothetical protein